MRDVNHTCDPTDKYCREGANPRRHPDHDSHTGGCICPLGQRAVGNMAKVTIGSISTGTLRTEDLLDAFASELERLDSGHSALQLISRAKDGVYTVAAGLMEQEDAPTVVDELQDALSELAPPHVYFGSLEGREAPLLRLQVVHRQRAQHPDGADFGFWPELDFGFCTLRAGDSDDERVDDDCGIIIHVNDHGNVAVYDLERNPLWSAV